MSTRKDKFNQRDRYFMNLAFNLARDRLGLTGENPSVGCVIVKNNEVISLGQTGLNGRPHSEYNAIKSSKYSLKGSKMYVSLEPCTHYGKTPPCSNLIIKSKIKEVIFSMIDVDKRTQLKSFKVFKDRNIKVKSGIMQSEANKLYKSYVYNKKEKLPFVTGKLAVSKDNFIFSKKKKRITNHYSDRVTQLLRYKNDTILISSKTLNADNPKLNCRIRGLSKHTPRRVILDKNLSTKLSSFIFKTSNKKNTIVIYSKAAKNKINQFKKKGIKLIKLTNKKNGFFDLKSVLNNVYLNGCRNLLVEGGKTLTNNFLKDKLFNQFFLFKSNSNLGKNAKFNVSGQLHQLKFIYKTKSKLNSFTGSDIIYLYS